MLLSRARHMRAEDTLAEKLAWRLLRNRRLLGLKFRRQVPIDSFIVDFYCHKAALVVEVDGDIHDLQREEDARREAALRELGLRIVRFRNDEVLNNLSTVIKMIKEQIKVASNLIDLH